MTEHNHAYTVQFEELMARCDRVVVAADLLAGQPYVNGTFLYAEIAGLREMLARHEVERLSDPDRVRHLIVPVARGIARGLRERPMELK